MTEISEDLFDVAFGAFFAVVLLLAALQFMVAGVVLSIVGYPFAAVLVLAIAMWVSVFTHGMLTDGKSRWALQQIGMFEDSEPFDMKAERLWGGN